MTSQNDIKLGENSIADRAIFIGRGHNVYNAIGNRRFRKLVDMFVQEYVECSNRSHKSGLVRTIIEVSEKAGYRFLQQDESGVFRELSYEQKKKKVGHSLRDRSGLLDQHLALKLKTRPDLKREGRDLIEYIHSIVPRQPELRETEDFKPRHATTNLGKSENRNRDAAKNLSLKSSVNCNNMKNTPGDIYCGASRLLELSSGMRAAPKNSASETRGQSVSNSSSEYGRNDSAFPGEFRELRFSERKFDHPRRTIQTSNSSKFISINQLTCNSGKVNMQKMKQRSQKAFKKRCFRELSDILGPALEKGQHSLPFPGSWDFIPLSEFQNKKIDLGAEKQGWKLCLEPISFPAEKILLDIPIPSSSTSAPKEPYSQPCVE